MKYEMNLKIWLVILILFLNLAIPTISVSSTLESSSLHPRMFQGGSKHQGRSPYELNETGNSTQWIYNTTDASGSQPIIDENGNIYLSTGVLSETGSLHAFTTTGQHKWKFSTPTSSSIRSTPAVDENGTIYIGSYNGIFYALNPNGTIKWSFDIGGNIYSSPVIDENGTIYVGSGVVDPKGSNDWGVLYAFNPDGTMKWNFSTQTKIASSPAIEEGGTIYISAQGGDVYALRKDGSQKWSFDLGYYTESSPTIGDDGTIYVGCIDENLYAINPDGTKKWEFSVEGYIDGSVALGEDGTIYVGTCSKGELEEGKTLYAISPEGDKKWVCGDGAVVSSPVISKDGTIIVGSLDSNVYAINSNGTKRWSYKTEAPVWGSPNIGPNGTVYIGSGDAKLYALHGGNVGNDTSNGNNSDSNGEDGEIPGFTFPILLISVFIVLIYQRRKKIRT